MKSKERKRIDKELQDALLTLELKGGFVTFKEIKESYKRLSKKYHPDFYKGDSGKIVQINRAYEVLKEYIENFRYSFDEDEIRKQYPEHFYADRFRF